MNREAYGLRVFSQKQWDDGEDVRTRAEREMLRSAFKAHLQAPSNTHSLSKRDAVAFVRAARRYSLQSRLADVAAEVGGAVDQAEPQAQQLLWAELEQGCRRALELAAEQDKMQGQLHDPREVMMDFFGCAVKASDFRQHLAAMDLLAAQVNSLQAKGQDPAAAFRLEAAAVPTAPKWGNALGRTPRDDSALLVGVHLHGLGHWEAIIGDARLGLQGKLGCVLSNGAGGGAGGGAVGRDAAEQAPGGNKGQQVLLKASHLETRVLGL